MDARTPGGKNTCHNAAITTTATIVSRRRGITFPLLADAGSVVIKDYGILNTSVPSTNQQQYGIPFPGTFFVDRQGVVTSRVFETAYQERDTITSVMVRLGARVSAPATTIALPICS